MSVENQENGDVANNAETTTEKKLGGITGKGFMPGQSGNPSGRPKKKWLTEVYEELLEEKLSDPEFRKQFKESQWAKLMSQKVVGAMTLDKAWERTEGKVKDEVDMNIKGDIGDILEAIRTRKHGK